MQRVNYKDLELLFHDGSGFGVYNYQGIPFTGIIDFGDAPDKFYHDEEYENGYQQGWIRYYYINGKIREKKIV